MTTHNETGRFVRILTFGKALPEIEGDILRVMSENVRVLLSTSEGLSGFDKGTDSRNAAIAEWAEGLSQQHRLEWRRVGRDVLFSPVQPAARRQDSPRYNSDAAGHVITNLESGMVAEDVIHPAAADKTDGVEGGDEPQIQDIASEDQPTDLGGEGRDEDTGDERQAEKTQPR